MRWGVHNGVHLDLLSVVPSAVPSEIEYGEGLVFAESIAMSAELLAGAEGLIEKNSRVIATVADGIEERISRLTLSGCYGESAAYQRAVRHKSAEFSELPVLAEAYVTGPLDLIRRGYLDRRLPVWISRNFQDRWRYVARANTGLAECIDQMQL